MTTTLSISVKKLDIKNFITLAAKLDSQGLRIPYMNVIVGQLLEKSYIAKVGESFDVDLDVFKQEEKSNVTKGLNEQVSRKLIHELKYLNASINNAVSIKELITKVEKFYNV